MSFGSEVVLGLAPDLGFGVGCWGGRLACTSVTVGPNYWYLIEEEEGRTAEINPEAAKGFVAELACLQEGGEDLAPTEDCFEADFGVICGC